MTPKKNEISKRDAARRYAAICREEYKEVARRAFLDGAVFWDMVKSGAVTAEMLDDDFFAVLTTNNNAKML